MQIKCGSYVKFKNKIKFKKKDHIVFFLLKKKKKEMIFAKPISKSYTQLNKAAIDHRQRSIASQDGVIRHLPSAPPGQNTGVGSHSLLQGSFPTQGSNPGLLHCRWILYQLSHQGSPKVSCREAKVVFNPLATVSITFIHFIIKDAEIREFK